MPRYKHDQKPPSERLIGTFRERIQYQVYELSAAFSLNRNEEYDPTDEDEALDWEEGKTYIMYAFLDGKQIGNPERITPRKLRAIMEPVQGATARLMGRLARSFGGA